MAQMYTEKGVLFAVSTALAELLGWQKKIHSCFSRTSYRKTRVNFWANPIFHWNNIAFLRRHMLSVQFSHSVVFDSVWPRWLQHAKPPCPLPTLGVYSDSWLSSQWGHPITSSSVVPFSRLQSFPASGSFPMSQFFTSGGQSFGVSALASVRPMNTQDWSSLMATHSCILAWRIPCTEKTGGLQSMGSQRVGHNWATSLSLSLLGKCKSKLQWGITVHKSEWPSPKIYKHKCWRGCG